MNENIDHTESELSLEGEIERANIKVALARGRDDLDEAFDLVSSLIEKAPNDRKVFDIAKRLAQKDKDVLPQLKRMYRSKGVTSFMEADAERLDNEMRQSAESGDFASVQRIRKEAEAAGLATPISQDIYERAQIQNQQEQQGIVVPSEIRIRLSRAKSTYRAFDYPKCIDLCTEGLDILEKLRAQLNSESYQYLQKELGAQMDQAQFKLDRRNVLFEGLGRINKGNWTEAQNLFREALESFSGDEVFENELEKLEKALEDEAELDRQVGQLRSEVEYVDTLIEIEQGLADLPSRVSASTPATERQKRTRDSLERIKRGMINRFKTIGSRNLELSSTANTDADKRKLLIEGRDHLALVEKLDGNDIDASAMLRDIIRQIQQIEANEIERVRTKQVSEDRRKLLRKVSYVGIIILALGAIAVAANSIMEATERNRIQSEEIAIAQQNATGTVVVNNAILTANANSTNLAIQQTLSWQTQEAQSTIDANTAIARATDILLTANAQTAEARQTQQSIEFALLTATQSGIEAQTAFQQTKAVETATISALMTQTANAPTATPTPSATPSLTPTPLYLCQGVVTITQGVNVRERPSVNSPDVGAVRNGALVEIYTFRESNNSNIEGWYQIVFLTEAGSGQGGWIASNYVAPIGCPENFGN